MARRKSGNGQIAQLPGTETNREQVIKHIVEEVRVLQEERNSTNKLITAALSKLDTLGDRYREAAKHVLRLTKMDHDDLVAFDDAYMTCRRALGIDVSETLPGTVANAEVAAQTEGEKP